MSAVCLSEIMRDAIELRSGMHILRLSRSGAPPDSRGVFADQTGALGILPIVMGDGANVAKVRSAWHRIGLASTRLSQCSDADLAAMIEAAVRSGALEARHLYEASADQHYPAKWTQLVERQKAPTISRPRAPRFETPKPPKPNLPKPDLPIPPVPKLADLALPDIPVPDIPIPGMPLPPLPELPLPGSLAASAAMAWFKEQAAKLPALPDKDALRAAAEKELMERANQLRDAAIAALMDSKAGEYLKDAKPYMELAETVLKYAAEKTGNEDLGKAADAAETSNDTADDIMGG